MTLRWLGPWHGTVKRNTDAHTILCLPENSLKRMTLRRNKLVGTWWSQAGNSDPSSAVEFGSNNTRVVTVSQSGGCAVPGPLSAVPASVPRCWPNFIQKEWGRRAWRRTVNWTSQLFIISCRETAVSNTSFRIIIESSSRHKTRRKCRVCACGMCRPILWFKLFELSTGLTCASVSFAWLVMDVG